MCSDILSHEIEHESIDACLDHCASKYGWDLRELSKTLRLDIYGSIRVVNYLRKEVVANRAELDDVALIKLLQKPFLNGVRPALLEDDAFLFPVLQDDALLPALNQESFDGPEEAGVAEAADGVDALRIQNEQLRSQLSVQQALLDDAKTSLIATLQDPSASDAHSSDSEDDHEPAAQRGVSSITKGKDGKSKNFEANEKSYFDSYAKTGIHHEMLSDHTRTESYRLFLQENPSLIKDKIVLDVGCGTGILSMFAAQAGAKHVYAIDMSDILTDAREIVRKNGFADKITLFQGKVEDIKLPVDQVDVIVSEWMGYFLLYESMLDSVIWARDKYLSPGGVCMPDHTPMYISAIQDDARLNFWDNVYGFQMPNIKEKVHRQLTSEPVVDNYDGECQLSDSFMFRDVDCQNGTVADLEFIADFKVVAHKSGKCDAMLTWFDTIFREKCDREVVFTTGPHVPREKQTHWRQTALYLAEPVLLEEGDAISGKVHCHRRKENARHLDILLEYAHTKKGAVRGETKFQNYALC